MLSQMTEMDFTPDLQKFIEAADTLHAGSTPKEATDAKQLLRAAFMRVYAHCGQTRNLLNAFESSLDRILTIAKEMPPDPQIQDLIFHASDKLEKVVLLRDDGFNAVTSLLDQQSAKFRQNSVS